MYLKISQRRYKKINLNLNEREIYGYSLIKRRRNGVDEKL